MASYVMEFQVLGNMAFLSHLELMKIFRQAFRRSSLEVKFSEGFNPHMKLSFAIAKSVGLESKGELLEIEVKDKIDNKKFQAIINEFLPKGLEVVKIKEKEKTSKSLSALLKKAVYRIWGEKEVIERIEGKLEEKEIMVNVRTKRKEEIRNIKEFIVGVKIGENDLFITVFAGSEKNLRIDYLLKYLNEEISVERVKLLGENKEIIAMV